MRKTICAYCGEEMKTVRPGRAKIIHVETELGIVNIYVGLTDAGGRKVETVEMIPNQYVGETEVLVIGRRFVENKPEMKAGGRRK